MKWIIGILVVAAAIWACFNIDFLSIGSNTENTLKQEKTMKKYFESTNQNQAETEKALEDY